MSNPEKPGPRLPEVGDIVHMGYTRIARDGSGLGAYPSIVLAVDTPGDPATTLTLTIMRPQGALVLRGAKYAETLTNDRWNWPGPRADGRPR